MSGGDLEYRDLGGKTRAAWRCDCGALNAWDRITCHRCAVAYYQEADATEAGAQYVIPGAEARNVARKPQRPAEELPLFQPTED